MPAYDPQSAQPMTSPLLGALPLATSSPSQPQRVPPNNLRPPHQCRAHDPAPALHTHPATDLATVGKIALDPAIGTVVHAEIAPETAIPTGAGTVPARATAVLPGAHHPLHHRDVANRRLGSVRPPRFPSLAATARPCRIKMHSALPLASSVGGAPAAAEAAVIVAGPPALAGTI